MQQIVVWDRESKSLFSPNPSLSRAVGGGENYTHSSAAVHVYMQEEPYNAGADALRHFP